MKKRLTTMALAMTMALFLAACGGDSGSTGSATTGNASAETSKSAVEEAKAEEEAKAAAEAAAEASLLAEEEAEKKAEEEAKAAEDAIKKELEEYGIEAVEEGVLAEIAAACEKEDYEEVWTLLFSDSFKEEAQALEASGEENKIVQSPNGRIGIYRIPGYGVDSIGDYFVYYGDYQGNERTGKGVWLEPDFLDGTEYRVFHSGEWKGDLPNGSFYLETLHNGRSIITEGVVADGLWDGDTTNTIKDDSGETNSWTAYYINGYYAPAEFEEYIRNDGQGLEELELIEVTNMNGGTEWLYRDENGNTMNKNWKERRSGVLGFENETGE